MSAVQFEAASDGGPVLEPGTYILETDSIEDAEPGQYGPQLSWSFKVSDAVTPDEPIRGADAEPYRFFQWTGTRPTPRSRCRQLIEALYGRPLINGERPRADLMHRPAHEGADRPRRRRERQAAGPDQRRGAPEAVPPPRRGPGRAGPRVVAHSPLARPSGRRAAAARQGPVLCADHQRQAAAAPRHTVAVSPASGLSPWFRHRRHAPGHRPFPGRPRVVGPAAVLAYR